MLSQDATKAGKGVASHRCGVLFMEKLVEECEAAAPAARRAGLVRVTRNVFVICNKKGICNM